MKIVFASDKYFIWTVKKITSFGRKIGIATTINGSEDRQILHLDKNLKKTIRSTRQYILAPTSYKWLAGEGGVCRPEGGHRIYGGV